jgi:hypothetical protein
MPTPPADAELHPGAARKAAKAAADAARAGGGKGAAGGKGGGPAPGASCGRPNGGSTLEALFGSRALQDVHFRDCGPAQAALLLPPPCLPRSNAPPHRPCCSSPHQRRHAAAVAAAAAHAVHRAGEGARGARPGARRLPLLRALLLHAQRRPQKVLCGEVPTVVVGARSRGSVGRVKCVALTSSVQERQSATCTCGFRVCKGFLPPFPVALRCATCTWATWRTPSASARRPRCWARRVQVRRLQSAG